MTDLQFVRIVRARVRDYLVAYDQQTLAEMWERSFPDPGPMMREVLESMQDTFHVLAELKKLPALRTPVCALRSILQSVRLDRLAVTFLKTLPGEYGDQFLDELREPGEHPALPASLPHETDEERVARYLASAQSLQIEEACRVTSLSEQRIRLTKAWKSFEERNLDRYLVANPDAITSDVQQEFGFAFGKTNKMNAWKDHMLRRRAAKPPRKPKERPISVSMLEGHPDEQVADPSDAPQSRELLWRWIIAKAPPETREQLKQLAIAERDVLTQYLLDNLSETDLADKQPNERVDLFVAVTEMWLDEREQERRARDREDRH